MIFEPKMSKLAIEVQKWGFLSHKRSLFGSILILRGRYACFSLFSFMANFSLPSSLRAGNGGNFSLGGLNMDCFLTYEVCLLKSHLFSPQ